MRTGTRGAIIHMRSRRRVARISVFVGLAVVFGGITAAVAQQGPPVIKIYVLTPDSPCISWLQMRTLAAADTVGLVDTIRSAYIQGFVGALWGTRARPVRRVPFDFGCPSVYPVVVDALDTACGQQPGKSIELVLLNLLGYR